MSSAATSPLDGLDIRVTQARIFVSELTKLRTLRSTRWSLLVATVLTIGFPSLVAAIVSSHWGGMSPGDRETTHPLDIALVGIFAAQLAIGVLGVLVMTGEYSTGMIRATLTAVPKRVPALLGKVAVFAAVAFTLMLPAVLAAFFATQAILSRHDTLRLSFSAPAVARSLIGGALYLAVLGIFTLGIGAVVRNTAGGIATFAGIMFVIPPLLNLLPGSWHDAIAPRLPDAAGRAVFSRTHGSDLLAPWPGFALFCGYAAAAVAIAAVLLLRRDA